MQHEHNSERLTVGDHGDVVALRESFDSNQHNSGERRKETEMTTNNTTADAWVGTKRETEARTYGAFEGCFIEKRYGYGQAGRRNYVRGGGKVHKVVTEWIVGVTDEKRAEELALCETRPERRRWSSVVRFIETGEPQMVVGRARCGVTQGQRAASLNDSLGREHVDCARCAK